MIAAEADRPQLMRELLGESLRELRNADRRTLREVSSSARVRMSSTSTSSRLPDVPRAPRSASLPVLSRRSTVSDAPCISRDVT